MPHCLLGLECASGRILSPKIVINWIVSIEVVQKDQGRDKMQAYRRCERKGHDGGHGDRQRPRIQGARSGNTQHHLRKDKISRSAFRKRRSFRAFGKGFRPTVHFQKECGDRHRSV